MEPIIEEILSQTATSPYVYEIYESSHNSSVARATSLTIDGVIRMVLHKIGDFDRVQLSLTSMWEKRVIKRWGNYREEISDYIRENIKYLNEDHPLSCTAMRIKMESHPFRRQMTIVRIPLECFGYSKEYLIPSFIWQF